MCCVDFLRHSHIGRSPCKDRNFLGCFLLRLVGLVPPMTTMVLGASPPRGIACPNTQPRRRAVLDQQLRLRKDFSSGFLQTLQPSAGFLLESPPSLT